MSKELIERLQTCCPDPEKFKGEPHWPREAVVELCQEAADELERLEAALREIASDKNRFTNHGWRLAKAALDKDTLNDRGSDQYANPQQEQT